MTEYWKSNARKFCDYCKCWFADNKPSIDFHEAGKKHKENVAKRLQEIGKKGRDDYETSLRMDDYMKEMEQAALRAYKDDIASNPDLTGSAIADLAKEKNADIVLKSDRDKPPEKKPRTDSKWLEAKSNDGGRSYYFHTDTRETKWEIPAEGFVSLEEQKMLKEEKKKAKKKKKEHRESNSKNEGKGSLSGGEGGTSSASGDKGNFNEETEEVSAHSKGARGYGSWTAIEKPVMPDLQLPTVVCSGADDEDEYDYSNFPKPEPHQFTQKTVTLKGTSVGTDFKKRKTCDSFKKNARKRNEDL